MNHTLIAKWVCTNRKRLGLTRAIRIGTTARSVQRWEAGTLPVFYQAKLEQLFNVPMPQSSAPIQRHYSGDEWREKRNRCSTS